MQVSNTLKTPVNYSSVEYIEPQNLPADEDDAEPWIGTLAWTEIIHYILIIYMMLCILYTLSTK